MRRRCGVLPRVIGKQDLAKLNNVDHAALRVTEFSAQWGDDQMTCLVHRRNARTAGRLPIVFQSTADAEYPLPVALMGFEPENLFSQHYIARIGHPVDDAQRAILYCIGARSAWSVRYSDRSSTSVTTSGGEALFWNRVGTAAATLPRCPGRIEASHPHTLAFANVE